LIEAKSTKSASPGRLPTASRPFSRRSRRRGEHRSRPGRATSSDRWRAVR
jgi:hypothetical protein